MNIRAFYEDLYDYFEKVTCLDQDIYKKDQSKEELLAACQKRNDTAKKLFSEIEQKLDQGVRPIIKDYTLLDDTKCKEFVDVIHDNRQLYAVDPETSFDLMTSVISYLSERPYLKSYLVKAYFVKAYSASFLAFNSLEQQLKYYNLVIDAYPHYADIPDKTTRRLVCMAYVNRLIAQCGEKIEDINHFMKDYDAAYNLFSDAKLSSLDEDFDFPYLVEYIKRLFSSIALNSYDISKAPDLIKARYYEVTKERYEKNKDDIQKLDYSKYLLAQEALGEVDHAFVIKELYQIIKKQINAEKEVISEDDNIRLMLEDIPNLLRIINKHKDAEVIKIKKELLEILVDYCKKLPLSSENTMVNSLIYENVCPVLFGIEDKWDFLYILFRMTTLRNFVTAYHSILVAKLVKAIVDHILIKTPDFLNVEELKDLSDAQAYKATIFAALIHDIGKAICTDIIDKKIKKISDSEFQIMKRHPLFAVEMLGNKKEIAFFKDVCLKHHLFYNGKGGYPLNVSLDEGKMREIISIVTIADSLEAGSDYLGRGYSRAKSFKNLLAEFNDQAGVRYSPRILSYINNSPELQQEIVDIIEVKRSEVFYNVYELIVNKSSTDLVAFLEEELNSL